MEISGSKEYKDMQKMYFKSDSYTNPTGEDAEYDSAVFCPMLRHLTAKIIIMR